MLRPSAVRPVLRNGHRIVFRRLPRPSASRSYTRQPAGQGALSRSAERKVATPANKQERMGEALQTAQKAAAESFFSQVIPGTFIPSRLADLPSSPKYQFPYQWARLKAFVIDFASVFAIRWGSRPAWYAIFSKPRAEIYRAGALAAGKALHARLGQALAEGDAQALRKICSNRLSETLTAAIARRPAWERIEFKLMAVHSAKLVAHRIAILPPPFPKNTMLQQAVVAVDSTQSLRRINTRDGDEKNKGNVVPGTDRVQRKVEYLALGRRWNGGTYQAGEWEVLGNVKPTTLESWREEQERIALMEASNADSKLQQAGKEKMR